jgi:hypothetical protein
LFIIITRAKNGEIETKIKINERPSNIQTERTGAAAVPPGGSLLSTNLTIIIRNLTSDNDTLDERLQFRRSIVVNRLDILARLGVVDHTNHDSERIEDIPGKVGCERIGPVGF